MHTKWRPQAPDRGKAAGDVHGACFHRDLLAARRIHGAHPRRHIDAGSRIDGLVAHVASVRPIEVIDDAGDLRESIPPNMAMADPTLGCRREGCAAF